MRTGTGGSGPMVNDVPNADHCGPEGPERPVGAAGADASGGPPSRRSRWRGWRPWVKPVRRVVLLLILALVVEYLVVPELVGARKDLFLLDQVNGGWAVAGVVLEVLSLFSYAVLTKVLLPPGPKPSLSRLFRIDLSAAAVAHVIPAGTLGTAALGFRLFTNEGISANDAGVMMAAKGLGSTIVLNVLLWLSLVISIPLAGFRPDLRDRRHHRDRAAGGGGAGDHRRHPRHRAGLPDPARRRRQDPLGERRPARGRRPRGQQDRVGDGQDKHVLAWALIWASLNWLLDAASLWCFIAAFGSTVNPIELFAAYGIANVAGALPLTPGGLGVVDSAAPLLLVGFGVTRSVATLGVLAWRLVNFWLPIPVGALSYVSLKVKPGQGRAAMETAVAGMLAVVGARPTGRPVAGHGA